MLLKTLCNFSKGIQIKRDDTNTRYEIPYLHYGDIYKLYNVSINLENIYNEIIKVNNSYYNSKYQIDNNDIVMNLTSENYSDLGKCVLIKNNNNRKFLAGMETHLIKIISDKILPEYLNYYFESNKFLSQIKQYITGMKVFRVKPYDILNIDIDLPVLSQQQHIVDIIGSLDDKIENNIKLIENYFELGDLKYSKLNADTKPLSNYVSFQKGKEASAQNYLTKKVNNSINYIRVKDLNSITDTYIPDNLNIPTAKENDVLISFDGAIGRINTGLNGAYSSGVYKAIPNNTNDYGIVLWSLRNKDNQQIMLEHTNGTTILHGSKSIEYLIMKNHNEKETQEFNLLFDNIVVLKKENTKLNELKQLYLKKFFG